MSSASPRVQYLAPHPPSLWRSPTHQPASFSLLPPELALTILAFVVDRSPSPQSDLARFVQINTACAALATPLLYASPCVTSLARLDALLAAVAAGHASQVCAVRVEGKVFASKGYGVRIHRVLKACRQVERCEIIGVDDLRAKHLVGDGVLTHLSLFNSSFSPNSLTAPPTLGPCLSSLTHLTLANVGMPAPSSHLTDILAICAPQLEFLALSSLRDVDAREFARALCVLADDGRKLQSVKLGFMTDEQVHALCAPLPQRSDSPSLPTPPPSPSAQTSFAHDSSTTSTLSFAPPTGAPASGTAPTPALALLRSVTHLTLTLPLPTLPLLLALPDALRVLAIRPPYARSSSSPATSTPTIFGTSRESLLRVLGRRDPAPVATPMGMQTPANPPVAPGRRPPIFALEQLEEEERVVLALEEALGRRVTSPGQGRRVESPECRAGDGGAVVAPRLAEVRWEGRALRSAKGRIRDALEWRQRLQRGDC